jgi:hypothetical protein
VLYDVEMDFTFQHIPNFCDILKQIELEVTRDLGACPINVPILAFPYFIGTRNIDSEITIASCKKRGTLFDLKNFFKYQNDLDLFIIIVEDLIFRRNSIDWYMLADPEANKGDQFYGYTFGDIKFDLIRFVQVLKSVKLPYSGTKPFDLNLLRRYRIKFSFFMIRVDDRFRFHRANPYKFLYNVVKLTALFSFVSFIGVSSAVPGMCLLLGILFSFNCICTRALSVSN